MIDRCVDRVPFLKGCVELKKIFSSYTNRPLKIDFWTAPVPSRNLNLRHSHNMEQQNKKRLKWITAIEIILFAFLIFSLMILIYIKLYP